MMTKMVGRISREKGLASNRVDEELYYIVNKGVGRYLLVSCLIPIFLGSNITHSSGQFGTSTLACSDFRQRVTVLLQSTKKVVASSRALRLVVIFARETAVVRSPTLRVVRYIPTMPTKSAFLSSRTPDLS